MSNSGFFVAPERLESDHVILEPMQPRHAEGLYEIGVDPSIWQWLPRGELNSLEDARKFVREALCLRDTGAEFPFTVIHKASGKVAGSTRYLEISEPNRGLEIGWTWYGTEYQRTSVNTECKLALMGYAFEVLGAIRLQLKTDGRNVRSQKAILRVGGRLEGTLRKHRILPKDGFVRDSVYFSVLDEEWPEVKERLQAMLSQTR